MIWPSGSLIVATRNVDQPRCLISVETISGVIRAFRLSMIFSDLPTPAEASVHRVRQCVGFAQAGNRYPLLGSCSVNFRLGHRNVCGQEIEVAAFVRLPDMRREHGAVAALVAR